MSSTYIIAADICDIYSAFHLPNTAVLDNHINILNLVSRTPAKSATHPKDLAELLILLEGPNIKQKKEIVIISLPFSVIKSSGNGGQALRQLNKEEFGEFANHYIKRVAELSG